jgi:TPR repeat protein
VSVYEFIRGFRLLILRDRDFDEEQCRRYAERGDTYAQYILGNKYARGIGAAQDYEQAASWYRRAAERGSARAQYRLGRLYEGGQEGVPKDDQIAAQWFSKAAEQGRPASRRALHLMYNSTDTQMSFRRLADGVEAAQYALSVMYENGRGVERNLPRAFMWLSLVAVRWKPTANHIYYLAEKMTPEQIAEGKKLAENWRPACYGLLRSLLWRLVGF